MENRKRYSKGKEGGGRTEKVPNGENKVTAGWKTQKSQTKKETKIQGLENVSGTNSRNQDARNAH